MIELPADLILKIIWNLPLKLLVQCKCLNKNFNLLISDPFFIYKYTLHCSKNIDCLLHYSNVDPERSICKIHLQSHHSNDVEVASQGYISAPSLHFELSSSGGLLLLSINHNCLCVFNPVIGAYQFIPSAETTCIGFAYELENPSAYKLVAVCEKCVANGRLYTFKIFDSEGSSWRVSPTTCSSNRIPLVDGFQAVYFDDSLHWLKKDGEILAFNVKKELGVIIRKPEGVKSRSLVSGDYSSILFGVHAWLGVSHDFLAMVVAYSSKIYIYAYDSIRSGWTLDKEFENKFAYGHGIGSPVFYDGKRLIQRGGNSYKEIYVYDVAATSWRKIGDMPYWLDASRRFRPFFRTLATIPGCSYLQERREENPEILEILSVMRKFLS